MKRTSQLHVHSRERNWWLLVTNEEETNIEYRKLRNTRIVEKETDGFWLQMKRRKQRISFWGESCRSLGILWLHHCFVHILTVLFIFSIRFLESINREKKWSERDQGSVFSKIHNCFYLFVFNCIALTFPHCVFSNACLEKVGRAWSFLKMLPLLFFFCCCCWFWRLR